MARPTEATVAQKLTEFARALKAEALKPDMDGVPTDSLDDISDDAENLAASLNGYETPAPVDIPDKLFDLAERAQAIRTAMNNPADGATLQTAVENLKNVIISHRVIQMRDGTSVWTK